MNKFTPAAIIVNEINNLAEEIHDLQTSVKSLEKQLERHKALLQEREYCKKKLEELHHQINEQID